jgi:mannose-6-phosphate isomerase
VQIYPLILEPIYKEKVWGGRRLERLGRELPGDSETRIGESWEVVDLSETSPSGGGGGAARSIVANGPLAGRTLHDLLRDRRSVLLGRASATEEGGFPLLIKYLDARENLSIQTHPSPAYAAAHPDAHLKSEAWYVIDAEPGAVIYKGLVAGTTVAALEDAIHHGTVQELMVRVPAVPGEAHYLPSGTCHALGAGVLVAEVQTASDTTFRLFDWGRTHRELHIRAALECVQLGPVDASVFEPDDVDEHESATVRSLVRCAHFTIAEWRARRGHGSEAQIHGPEVWMVVEGRAEIRSPEGAYHAVAVGPAQTVLVPAALDTVGIQATEPLLMLRVKVASG